MPKRASQPREACVKKRSLPTPLVYGVLQRGEVITDILGTKWRLGNAIGIGGFGEIYEVSPCTAQKRASSDVAHVAKVEKHSNGPLFVEINCYLRLGRAAMIEEWKCEKKLDFLGLPHYVASGSHWSNKERYRFLILPKYDKDLEAIFRTKRLLNLKTVLVIALRIIDTLEYIHSHGYVHSDIKASNIMLGSTSDTTVKTFRRSSRIKHARQERLVQSEQRVRRCARDLRHHTGVCYVDDIPELLDFLSEDEDLCKSDINAPKLGKVKGDQVFLLDYGLASKYILSSGKLRECSSDERRAHAGTILFCSRDAHKGIPSRRSDLESLAYNMIYWLTGTLPWIEDVDEPEVVEQKKNTGFSDVETFLAICFQNCPAFMIEMFVYLSKLQFKDTPDYDLLRGLCRKTIKEYGYKDDLKLDFDNLEPWEDKRKTTKKKVAHKFASFLACPLSQPPNSNIIFKRPKLRKENEEINNSMMNWSKILMHNPELIIKQARRVPEEDKTWNMSKSNLESLNPTAAMRTVFNRALEREDKSPCSWRGDEPFAVSSIDGYTAEMMRVHQRMLEQRELELQMLVHKNASSTTYPKKPKGAKARKQISSRVSKHEAFTSHHHSVKKSKSEPFRRTYSLRG